MKTTASPRPACAIKVSGRTNSTLLVGFDGERVGIQGAGQVVMFFAEQIELFEWCTEGVKLRGRPCFDAGMLVRRAQHQGDGEAVAVRGGVMVLTQRGAKGRRDGDAALGVQPVLVGAQELGHPTGPPFAIVQEKSVCRNRSVLVAPGRIGVMGCLGISWDDMGVKGIRREISILRGVSRVPCGTVVGDEVVIGSSRLADIPVSSTNRERCGATWGAKRNGTTP